MLGPFFFLLSFPTLLHQWNVLNRVPKRGASLTESCESNGEQVAVRVDDEQDCSDLKGNCCVWVKWSSFLSGMPPGDEGSALNMDAYLGRNKLRLGFKKQLLII